ncbi:MAG: hypothetical protein KDB27_35430 [Planctomycetales bacterium]|nr:hypothetical protein [Planctomycetales bacterium]
MNAVNYNKLVCQAVGFLGIVCLAGCQNDDATYQSPADVALQQQQIEVSRVAQLANEPAENGREFLKNRFERIDVIKVNPAGTIATVIGEPRTVNPGQQTVVINLSDNESEMARFRKFYRLTCVSPNGKQLAVIHSVEDEVRIDSPLKIARLRGSAAPMQSVFRSNDVRVYDFSTSAWIWIAGKSDKRIHAVAYSADSSAILTIEESAEAESDGSDDGLTLIDFHWWDAESGESIRKLSGPRVSLVESYRAWVGIAVNNDATRAAFWKPGVEDGQVVVSDTTTGELVRRLSQKNGFSVAGFNSDGSKLVTVGVVPRTNKGEPKQGEDATTELKVWDLSADTALVARAVGTTAAINFSPDDRRILLNEIDFSDPEVQSDLVVFDAENGAEVTRVRRIGYGPRFGFLSNDEIFATVVSREIDGVHKHVPGRVFAWKIADASGDLPRDATESEGKK